jgi:CBS domain-containing protein
MTLYEILKTKGSEVFTIRPDATLEEAAHELVRHNVGCLVVCVRDLEVGERLVGVVSERDILRFCVAGIGPLNAHAVSEIMTATVLADGRLIGLVSIGDVVKSQHDHLALENQFMKNYLTG